MRKRSKPTHMGQRSRRNIHVTFGPRVKRNFGFLYQLAFTVDGKERYLMVKNASDDELGAIKDVCGNIVKKNFRLTPKQEEKLKKHVGAMVDLSVRNSRNTIQKAVQRGEGIGIKKRAKSDEDRYIEVQEGGMLPAMLIPVLVELAAAGLEHILP